VAFTPVSHRLVAFQLAPPLAQHVLPKRLAGLDDLRVLVAESGGRQALREPDRKLGIVLVVPIIVLEVEQGPQAGSGAEAGRREAILPVSCSGAVAGAAGGRVQVLEELVVLGLVILGLVEILYDFENSRELGEVIPYFEHEAIRRPAGGLEHVHERALARDEPLSRLSTWRGT
jgi:hypothetical protein